MAQQKADKHIAIIVAAGRGERMQADKPKVLLDLAGRPVVSYALETFVKCPWMDAVIVVAAEEYLAAMRAMAKEAVHACNRAEGAEGCACIDDASGQHAGGQAKAVTVISGGAERTDSVRAGLEAAGEWLYSQATSDLTKEPSPCQGYVYIHDGARPFISQEVLDRVKTGVERCGACVCGVPVKDTIREVSAAGGGDAAMAAGGGDAGGGDADGVVLAGAFDRSRLRAIQTPQAFAYDLIREAYDKLEKTTTAQGRRGADHAAAEDTVPAACAPTDDAQVFEQMTGHTVCIVDGDYTNIKLTTPEDMITAEAFAKAGK